MTSAKVSVDSRNLGGEWYDRVKAECRWILENQKHTGKPRELTREEISKLYPDAKLSEKCGRK